MLNIKWKGKIGYGDIVSPISYAHCMSEKNQCDVQLDVHWEHEHGQKFKETDPETIDERMQYLFNIAEPSNYNVYLNHRFNERLNYNHTNYDDSSKYHNVWQVKEEYRWQDGRSKTIVLNTTENNNEQFSEYAPHKQWKDPLGIEKFKYLEGMLSDNYNVIKVDYTNPIEELVALYKNCDMAIGYHGSCMWVARYIGCPMIIYSNKSSLTGYSFPWAIVKQDLSFEDDMSNINFMYKLSKERMKVVYNEQTNFIKSEKNLHRLRGQRT